VPMMIHGVGQLGPDAGSIIFKGRYSLEKHPRTEESHRPGVAELRKAVWFRADSIDRPPRAALKNCTTTSPEALRPKVDARPKGARNGKASACGPLEQIVR
jgi:hypothetical protein